MRMCDMSERDQIPADLPKSAAEREVWLTRLAERMVERVWNEPLPEDLRLVEDSYSENISPDEQAHDSDDLYPFCFCKQGQSGFFK